jgi:peptidyl-tRNA hydrolase
VAFLANYFSQNSKAPPNIFSFILILAMIVQYIFIVSDIKSIKKGSLIAQACHASIKAIHVYKDDVDTREYLKYIDSMTTVILKIKYQDIPSILSNLIELDLVEWIEQPENIVTCIALRPYKIEALDQHMDFIRKFKLY